MILESIENGNASRLHFELLWSFSNISFDDDDMNIVINTFFSANCKLFIFNNSLFRWANFM
jgi:hypothetical protein